MSSPAPSDISQNDAEVLEKQRQEMQQRHKEEQRLLVQLEEAAKLHRAERMAQKARKEDDGVPPATLRRGARGRGRRIPGHRVQTQRGHRRRRGGAMALQES